MVAPIRRSAECLKKFPGMNGARLPTRRFRADLPEDIFSCRALTAWRQTEQFDIRRQCPHMKRPQRRLKNAGGIAAEVPELIVNRQSNAGAIRGLLKDQEIAEQSYAISDRTAGLIVTNSKQRVDDP